jgi:hypothetical protein
MEKINKWAVREIQKRGGIEDPCSNLCKNTYYKIGPFHVTVVETPAPESSNTMVMVFYGTTMSCWMVFNTKDKKKTQRILKAIASPETLRITSGMDIDDVQYEYLKLKNEMVKRKITRITSTSR